MPRTSKFSHKDILDIVQLKAEGKTYKQICEKYNLGRTYLSKILKNAPNHILMPNGKVVEKVASVTQIVNDTITDADNYSPDVITAVNKFVEEGVNISNNIVEMHKQALARAERTYKFLDKKMQSDTLAVEDLKILIDKQYVMAKIIEILSRIYGMGKTAPQTQVNIQNNLKQSTWHNAKQLPDDKFSSEELGQKGGVNLVLCTSDEQAKIIRGENVEYSDDIEE